MFFSCKTLLFPLLAVGLALTSCKGSAPTAEAPALDSTRICRVVFSGDSALANVKAQCAFGPRVPNSSAIERCGDFLEAGFRRQGLEVINQRTVVRGWDGTNLRCRNIIATYAPERKERIIIAAHYDSRPWADHDADSTKHRTPVMAADDGASGPAVMLELARLLREVQPKVGIDFICFDTEDYGAPYWAPEAARADENTWCLGSQYWSSHPHREGYTARCGILLDMVGGRGSKFHYEGYSLQNAQEFVMRIWEAARYAGAEDYFIPEAGGFVTDDHVPMNTKALIPTLDIIPYRANGTFTPHWHTSHDTPDNIDPATLRAVGQTVLQFISEEQP